MTDQANSKSLQHRELLPGRRESELFDFDHDGTRYTATVSRYADGRPAELFLDSDKPTSQLAGFAADAAILASLLMQHGVSVEIIRHSIAGPVRRALDMIGDAV